MARLLRFFRHACLRSPSTPSGLQREADRLGCAAALAPSWRSTPTLRSTPNTFLVWDSFFLLLFSPRPRRVSLRGKLVLVFFLRQPHSLGQAIVPYQQIHLDPLACALFIHGQAQNAERPALHTYTQYGGFLRP